VKIQITARHDRNISEETKGFIEAEILDLTKFYDNIFSAQIVLDKQKHGNGSVDIVDIILEVDQKKQIVGKATEENMGKAFDSAKEKIISQLKKQNEMKKSHAGISTSDFTADFTAVENN
jgi:ribosomal subunit interface protein